MPTTFLNNYSPTPPASGSARLESRLTGSVDTVRGARGGARFASRMVGSRQSVSGTTTGSAFFESRMRGRAGDGPNNYTTAAGTANFASSMIGSRAINNQLGGASGTADFASRLVGFADTSQSTEDSFTIIIDVIEPIAANGDAGFYLARLKQVNTVVPIQSFSVSAGKDLGKNFEAKLAYPDLSLIPQTAVVTFDIGHKQLSTNSYSFNNLINAGEFAGRNRITKRDGDAANDEIDFSARDGMALKLRKAPNVPQILYDPALVTQTPIADTENAVRDVNGNPILPVITPIAGLTFREACRRAYVVGCGFSAVQTNIPDFPVPKVEFTLEGGYHGAVAGLVGLFEPIYETNGNILEIIDPDYPPLPGQNLRDLFLSDVSSISDNLSGAQKFDTLLVTYNPRPGADEYYIDQDDLLETTEQGQYGTPGYLRTETQRRNRNWRKLDNPSVIIRSIPLTTKVTTYNNSSQIVSRSTLTEQFDATGLKLSHTNVIETRVPQFPSGDLLLQISSRQYGQFGYTPNPRNPSETLQSLMVLRDEGLVLIDHDNTDPLHDGQPQKIPLSDAKTNYLVDPNAAQTLEYGAIRTQIETLTARSKYQLELSGRVINHLSNEPDKTYSKPVPGTNSLGNTSNSNQKTVRLMTGATQVLQAASLNGGDLPRDLVVQLGSRKLRNLNNPPRVASASLPYLDFSIRRGSVFRCYDRNGSQGNFFVVGYSITGQNLGRDNQTFATSLSLREIIG